MRTILYRSLRLLILISLFFTGCAANPAEEKEPQSLTVNADAPLPWADWNVRYAELETGGSGKILGFAMTGSGLYTAYGSVQGSNEGYPLYHISSQAFKQVKTTYTFGEIYLGIPPEHQPICLFSTDEKLYILASCITADNNSCFMYTADADGRNPRQADITEAWNAAFGEEPGAVRGAADENGLVYIGKAGSECTILVAQEDGSQAFVLRQQDCRLYDLTSVGGQIYCAGRFQGADTLFRVDSQNRMLETVTALPDSRGTVMLRPGPEGSLLYGYYDAIYQYDPEKGEGRNVYAWADGGMDGRNVTDFFTDTQGKLWVQPNLKEETLVMMILQEPAVSSPDETTVEKETVVICGNRIWDTELAKAVGAFNIASSDYVVELREYDYDRLATEIMTGNGPDLIPLSAVGVSTAAGRGIVEDLNPYLEASEILSRNMLGERVLDLYTVDGRLTCIPPSFCIITLFGKESELGDEPGWTMEEFFDYVDSHRGLTVMEGVMRSDSRSVMMMMMWNARQQQWIDWKQGIAKFDQEEFKELLQFAATYESKYDGESKSAEDRWQEGKVLLYSRPVIDMKTYLWYQEVLADDGVAIGYPTQDGSPCNMLSAYGGYGISASSAHKEGAWAFIEYLVSSQTGEETYQHGIATLRSAMEDMLERSKEEKNLSISGYEISPATDEDIRQFRELLDNAVIRDGELSVVNEILTEELDICFSGGRSVDETVDVIQSRVQLYLDENH